VEVGDMQESAPRFDGLYACQHGDYSSYLRFTSSGRVSEVGSTGSAAQVADWLGPEKSDLSQGEYVADGGTLSFTTSSPSGQVTYDGEISPDANEIRFRIHSHINGNSYEATYDFVPVPKLGGVSVSWEELRSAYMSILAEEGFRPELDPEGDIHFRYEAGHYFITGNTDSTCCCFLFPGFWKIESDADRTRAMVAANDANRAIKAAKVWLSADGQDTNASLECLVASPSDLRPILSRCLNCLRAAVDRFVEDMRKA
jgi:hypothetical protein